MGNFRLLAVDPSLTCSGWAFFSGLNGKLLGVGKIRSLSPQYSMAVRLEDIQNKITKLLTLLEIGEEDVVVCEGQTTLIDPKAAFKVEQVRGIFEAVARSRSARVPGRVNPRTVQSEVIGLRGKQISRILVKSHAVRTAKAVYGEGLSALGFPSTEKDLSRSQDIVDALLIGSAALTHISSAMRAGIPIESAFDQRKLISRRKYA